MSQLVRKENIPSKLYIVHWSNEAMVYGSFKSCFREAAMDPSYEFTAPQFVDFTTMDPDGDGDEDKFFDVKNETVEEEVLGYVTARDGELMEGAMGEEHGEHAEEHGERAEEGGEHAEEHEGQGDLEEEKQEEANIIEVREGDDGERSGSSQQYSTQVFQSSDNSDIEEDGSSNEVRFSKLISNVPSY